MDFFADAEKLVRDHLTSVGVDHSKALKFTDVLHLALNRGMKRVKPVPRKIHRCKNFANKLALLDPKKQAAAQVIFGEIERGEDISGHLSKGIDRAAKTDDLLADWNIHHVHISDTKAKPTDKFFERSEEVLFIVFTPTAAYCLDVHSHDEKKHPSVWTRQSLFESIGTNWPELIEPFKIKGFSGSGNPLSDEHRKILRKNTLLPIEFNGALYFPPGGGLSTENTSLQVQVDLDRILIHLRQTQKSFEDLTNDEREELSKLTGTPADKFDFALVDAGLENWHVIETTSKLPLIRMNHPFR